MTTILLTSDDYSPMSAPHGLPALYFPRLLRPVLEEGSGAIEKIEKRLEGIGWQPAWRFGMYHQAHYHTTTHELLWIVRGNATIQLGGTDERAKPEPPPSSSKNATTIDVEAGDVLLLPAGYAHRALQDARGFTMIGSYPIGAEKWDMRFPNVMGCPFDTESIKKLVSSTARKGLGPAQCPSKLQDGAAPLLDDAWNIR